MDSESFGDKTMKIHTFGTVTLTTGPVKVEGWNIEREPEDPIEATDEQLLLGFAINWAQAQLIKATNDAMLDVFRRAAKQRFEDHLASLAQADGDSN